MSFGLRHKGIDSYNTNSDSDDDDDKSVNYCTLIEKLETIEMNVETLLHKVIDLEFIVKQQICQKDHPQTRIQRGWFWLQSFFWSQPKHQLIKDTYMDVD